MTEFTLCMTDVDQQLMEAGQFCLLEWLVQSQYVSYEHYEAWRQGQHLYLTDIWGLDTEALLTRISALHTFAKALNLISEPQAFYAWYAHASTPLQIAGDQALHFELSRRWFKAKNTPQLDLFFDNSALIAENQLLDALCQLQLQTANLHLDKLTHLNVQHAKLGGYQNLCIYGHHMVSMALIEPDQIAQEWAGLKQEVAPLARELLGQKAKDYLGFAWRRLASNLSALSAQSQPIPIHPSEALEQIPDWPGVIASLHSPSLWQSPEGLMRLAKAYFYMRQPNAFLLIWGYIFDAFGESMEAYIPHQPKLLMDYWDELWAYAEQATADMFLGFLLLRKVGLFERLQQTPEHWPMRPKNEANQAVIQLMQRKAAQQDENEARTYLQQCSPDLLNCYLRFNY